MHRRYRNVEIEQLAARLDDEAELKLTSKKLIGQDIEILAKPLRKNRQKDYIDASIIFFSLELQKIITRTLK
ncbi:unnamed protein product [Rotaria socialis]